MTVTERDLERRVEALEGQQTTWQRLTMEMFSREVSRDAQLHRMDSNISTLRSDVDTLKTDVAVLKTDVAVLKTDVAELKTDVAVLKTDVAELKTDMVDVKGQLNRLELAVHRNHNWVTAQFEWLRGYVVRRETGEG